MLKFKSGLLGLIAAALSSGAPSASTHRVATGTKSARRAMSRKTASTVHVDPKQAAEIRAWNAAVDAKKAAKKQAKLNRKAAA